MLFLGQWGLLQRSYLFQGRLEHQAARPTQVISLLGYYFLVICEELLLLLLDDEQTYDALDQVTDLSRIILLLTLHDHTLHTDRVVLFRRGRDGNGGL